MSVTLELLNTFSYNIAFSFVIEINFYKNKVLGVPQHITLEKKKVSK